MLQQSVSSTQTTKSNIHFLRGLPGLKFSKTLLAEKNEDEVTSERKGIGAVGKHAVQYVCLWCTLHLRRVHVFRRRWSSHGVVSTVLSSGKGMTYCTEHGTAVQHSARLLYSSDVCRCVVFRGKGVRQVLIDLIGVANRCSFPIVGLWPRGKKYKTGEKILEKVGEQVQNKTGNYALQ